MLLYYVQTGDSSLQLIPASPWLAGGTGFFAFAWSTISSIPSGLTPLALVSLGIVVLMLTPYVRVLAAVVFYAAEEDWRFFSITLTVLAIITLGLLVL